MRKTIIPIISAIFVIELSLIFNSCVYNNIPEMINRNDFAVYYNDFEINYDTAFVDILNEFGYGNIAEYEGNNYGYISGCPDARRFIIKYPDYENTQISLICIENYTTGNIFVERVRLDDAETQRGVREGDKKEDIFELYGENYQRELNDSDLCSYIYSDSAGHSICFTVYEISNTITDILLEYNTDSHESLMIENYQNAIINEPVNEYANELTYKIVPATEQEIEEIGDRLYIAVGMYFDDYDYTVDNIYNSLFEYNKLGYIEPKYDQEVTQYICEPFFYTDYGLACWDEVITEEDPLSRFGEIPAEIYDENGNYNEDVAFKISNSMARGEELRIGYNRFSGEYIDWLVEGVWNGKADHDTFFEFEDGTLCYYYDGDYYTPEFFPDGRGGPMFLPDVISVTPLPDNKYEVIYNVKEELDEPMFYGKVTVAMKEADNGFRFWSIFSIDYDIETLKE